MHLNFPFRKPLEPTPVDGGVSLSSEQLNGMDADKPFVDFSRSELAPSDAQVASLVNSIRAAERGLILCGPRCPDGDFPKSVTDLAKATGYPILADALSGVRFGPHVADADNLILGGYESYLGNSHVEELDAPELILHFGDVPTSKNLNDYLGRQTGTQRIQISCIRSLAR